MDTTLISEGQEGHGAIGPWRESCATVPAPHTHSSTLSPHACQQTYTTERRCQSLRVKGLLAGYPRAHKVPTSRDAIV
jgi:hypothetical protein